MLVVSHGWMTEVYLGGRLLDSTETLSFLARERVSCVERYHP